MYTNVDSKVRRVLFIFSFHFRVTRSFIFIIHIIFFFFLLFFPVLSASSLLFPQFPLHLSFVIPATSQL